MIKLREYISPSEQKKPFSLEQWLYSDLDRQYREKAAILNTLGLLEILPQTKEKGIVGIDGKEYPFPEKKAIQEEMMKNPEFYRTKMEQGFTEIEIVPFALPLEKLITTAEKSILKHHKEGKLFTNKKNSDDEKEELVALDLDKDEPFWHWDEYNNADINGSLVYYPKKFGEDHHGKTKQEIIGSPSSFPGYHVILREKNLNIPRQGKGGTIKGRAQLEADQSPEQYLALLKTQQQYTKEIGLTPEDWLTIFLVHLEKTDQVIDDWSENGSLCYLLGSFLPAFWQCSARPLVPRLSAG